MLGVIKPRGRRLLLVPIHSVGGWIRKGGVAQWRSQHQARRASPTIAVAVREVVRLVVVVVGTAMLWWVVVVMVPLRFVTTTTIGRRHSAAWPRVVVVRIRLRVCVAGGV